MWLASIIATIIRRVSSGHNGTNVWVEAHFPPWPNELLCVLCESVACSRLSSSLPQSSQRTATKTEKPNPRTLLCILRESLAFFAVKFFFTAKLAKNCHQERKAKPTHHCFASFANPWRSSR